MSNPLKSDELITLKIIAETLNKSNDLDETLNKVLKKLLEVTQLQTGWIFLSEEAEEYTLAAGCNLPPALSWDDHTPMCQGNCWCLSEYWEGEVKQAVNIIHCKRLDDAQKYQWGDTKGITHHATVPLMAGNKSLGLLNVASPDKINFSNEELALLQAVSYQIGTAIARTQLYQSHQRRGEWFAKLGEAVREINSIWELEKLPLETVNRANQYWQWPVVALFMKEPDALALHAIHFNRQSIKKYFKSAVMHCDILEKALQKKKMIAENTAAVKIPGLDLLPELRSAAAVPMMLRGEIMGMMLIGSGQKNAFDPIDLEVAEAYVDHIALAYENVRLFDQRQELTRWEERNRLARDLHDSVSQTLFSMTLTSRGIQHLLSQSSETVRDAVEEISQLSQHALKEMRSLILQLRPAGLDKGLATAIEQHGKALGLQVNCLVKGVIELPRLVEEALLRVGQEALNNIRKHAKTEQAYICLTLNEDSIVLEIADEGAGFDLTNITLAKPSSLGIMMMRERIEMLQGSFTMESGLGKGSKIKVMLPIHLRNEE